MTLYGLMHVCIVGAPQKRLPHFSMFPYGNVLDNFPVRRNKYNDMEKHVKLVVREYERGGGC